MGGEAQNLIRDVKYELMSIASQSSRGEYLSKAQSNKAIEALTILEAVNPSLQQPGAYSVLGNWELVFTDGKALFLNSPFFLTIREILGDKYKNIDRALQFTSEGQIGKVSQIITDSQLTSLVEVKLNTLPGLPFSVDATIATKANYIKQGDLKLILTLQESTITKCNIPIVRSLIQDKALPTGRLLQNLRTETGAAVLTTCYLDDDMRISKNADGINFVYVRKTD